MMQHTPAVAWLLLCLQQAVRADDQPWRQSQSIGAWEAVERLATTWGVAPLLYDRLKHKPDPAFALPPVIRQQLRQAYHDNTLQNFQIMKQLATLLAQLNAAAIPVIALKGCHLANFVYPALAMRTMNDIDLLVKPADVPHVAALLEALGYTLHGDEPLRRWFQEQHYHLIFIPPTGVPLELHWHIHPPETTYAVAIEELWQRAVAKQLGDAQLQVLAPEDLLLHLSVHTAKHKFSYMGIRAFCDIAEVLHYHEDALDWDQIEQRARQWHIERALFLVLTMTAQLLNPPLPPSILQRLQPADFEPTLVTTVYEQTLSQHNLQLSPHFTRFWSTAALPDRVNQLGQALCWPRTQLAAKYGVPADSWRIYLYYGVRLVDIIRHYRTLLWPLMRGKQAATTLVERERRLAEWLQ